MREINLNGYIDDEECFGDEITPLMLQKHLYGISGGEPTDVHITLNSYGGSCNAATRMYDMIRDYPAHVSITISGTAASAATVLASAARSVEMTPGSLYMIHDPSTVAWGNERDFNEAIKLLGACKDSILNIYGERCKKPREEIAKMMADTTWMDARAALEYGFIDRISNSETNSGAVANAARAPITNRKDAEAKVAAYYERQRGLRAQTSEPQHTLTPEPQRSGVSVEQLYKRLNLINR